MSNANPQATAASPRSTGHSPQAVGVPTFAQQWGFLIVAAGVVILCGSMIVVTFVLLRQLQAAKKEVTPVKEKAVSVAGDDASKRISNISPYVGENGFEPKTETSPSVKATLLRYQTRLQAAEESLQEIRDVGDLWATDFSDLMINESGRRIASDPEAVPQFIAVLDMERPTLAVMVSFQRRVDTLREPVERALLDGSDAPPVPVDEMLAEVELLIADLKPLRTSMVAQRWLVNNLVKKYASAAPSDKTLGDAIQKVRIVASSKEAAELVEARKVALEEAKLLTISAEKAAIAARAKAEAEATRILGESEAKEIVDAANLRKEKVDADLAAKKEEQRVTELRKRANDPLVQRKYSAFLDKGLATFSYRSGDGNSSPGDRPLPASWGELNQNGFIKDVGRFAKSMSADAFGVGKNDRRVSVMPKTEAEWKETDRLYEDFKQLGPIWVEMGLLLP